MSTDTRVPRPTALRFRDLLHRGGPALMCAMAAGTVFLFWERDLLPSNFVGEVQSPSSTISSPEAGRLTEVNVGIFESVTNGQVLARLSIRSEDSLRAELVALKAEQAIMHARMLQDQERNDLNALQLRNDLLTHRLELAGAHIRLRQAESEFERARVLFDKQLLSAGAGPDADGYEVALRDRDLLRAEVADRERQVAELELGLTTLRPADLAGQQQVIRETIDKAVASQELALREVEGPIVLRAPVDGMVMRVYRRKDENVGQAEVLFEIRGEQPGWILGFVRQPITTPPAVGDDIEVRSRGRPTQTGLAKVLKVGGHLEAFAQPLRVRGFDASMERGLPIMLSYPEQMTLHPGELVDLLPQARR